MMREMTLSEIAEHKRMLKRNHDQMPEDVRHAINIVRHWISMPDGIEETEERQETAIWMVRYGRAE